MKKERLDIYKKIRKDYNYYKVVQKIIELCSGGDKTILDIGSADIDLMSKFPFKERCSVATYGALNNDKVTGYEMDFFDFKCEKQFDVATCLQVIEHIKDAKKFTKKVLNTGKIAIISLPYNWEKDSCRTHVQDPIDENKIYSWTEKKPQYVFYIYDVSWRIICVYGELNVKQKMALTLLKLKYFKNVLSKNDSFDRNIFEMLFSMKNDKVSCHKVLSLFGFKFKFKSKKLRMRKIYEDLKLLVDNELMQKYTLKYEPVKNRICYLLTNSAPYFNGGYASRSHYMARALKQAGFDMVTMTRPGFPWDKSSGYENIPFEDVVDGIKYIRIKNSSKCFMNTEKERYMDVEHLKKTIAILEQEFLKHKPEYILATTFVELPAMLVARRLGIPFLYEARGLPYLNTITGKYPEYIRKSLIYLIEKSSQNAHHVFTLTSQMKEELINLGNSENKVTLVPNCADLDKFYPIDKDAILSYKLNLYQNVPVIGYIGTFMHYEGLEDLIEACNILNKRGVDFKVLLIGGNSAKADSKPNEELTKLVKKYKLDNKVIFLGKISIEDVPKYYSVIDIVAIGRKPLPVCETVSPIKPLEAMAMKKTVVVSSVQALKEMVEDNVTGLVFDKGDVNSYANTLERAIQDEELRKRLGENARKWIEENRQWTNNAKIIKEILKVTK